MELRSLFKKCAEILIKVIPFPFEIKINCLICDEMMSYCISELLYLVMKYIMSDFESTANVSIALDRNNRALTSIWCPLLECISCITSMVPLLTRNPLLKSQDLSVIITSSGMFDKVNYCNCSGLGRWFVLSHSRIFHSYRGIIFKEGRTGTFAHQFCASWFLFVVK